MLGLFGFKQRIDTQGTEQQGSDASRWSLTGALANDPTVLAGLTASNTQWLKSDSAALYGQISYKLTDALTIQPGVRINYDKKDGFYQRVVTDGAGAVISCTPAPAAGSVLAAQCGVYQPQTTSPSASKWNVSYDLNVNYKIASDVLAYATYAKSFKTLGINQNGLPLTTANVPDLSASTVKPESVNHFEIGLKTQFWDRRATFNFSAFQQNFANVTQHRKISPNLKISKHLGDLVITLIVYCNSHPHIPVITPQDICAVPFTLHQLFMCNIDCLGTQGIIRT